MWFFSDNEQSLKVSYITESAAYHKCWVKTQFFPLKLPSYGIFSKLEICTALVANYDAYCVLFQIPVNSLVVLRTERMQDCALN